MEHPSSETLAPIRVQRWPGAGPLRLAAAAALLLLAGCAAAASAVARPDRQAMLLSDREPPRAGCDIARTPASLPPLDQLVDTAVLRRGVAQFAGRERLRDGEMHTLFSVAWDRGGRPERVKAIDWWMPEGAAERLAAVVRPTLKRQPRGPGSARLRVEPGSAPKFQVGRSEYCPPVSGSTFRLTAPAMYPVDKPTPLRFRALVDARGNATTAHVLRSSGDPEVDRWVLGVVERYRYAPALLDGVAGPADYEQTVSVQARP